MGSPHRIFLYMVSVKSTSQINLANCVCVSFIKNAFIERKKSILIFETAFLNSQRSSNIQECRQ